MDTTGQVLPDQSNTQSDDEPQLIEELNALLAAYLTPEQIAEVHQAYLFGAQAHHGQQRRSGEPYIHHPLAVAKILAEIRMDYRSIMAAIPTLATFSMSSVRICTSMGTP